MKGRKRRREKRTSFAEMSTARTREGRGAYFAPIIFFALLAGDTVLGLTPFRLVRASIVIVILSYILYCSYWIESIS